MHIIQKFQLKINTIDLITLFHEVFIIRDMKGKTLHLFAIITMLLLFCHKIKAEKKQHDKENEKEKQKKAEEEPEEEEPEEEPEEEEPEEEPEEEEPEEEPEEEQPEEEEPKEEEPEEEEEEPEEEEPEEEEPEEEEPEEEEPEEEPFSEEESSEESDEEMDHEDKPKVEEPIEEVKDDPHHPHVSFDTGSEEEHLRNFKRISEDLQIIEDEYMACLDEINEEDFTEDAVEGCLGKDLIKLQIDIKYETMKIISRAEDKLRHYFVYHCYMPAGENEMKTIGCDLLQRDMLDALWNCMDFIELAQLNKKKYTDEYATIDRKVFKEIIANLENFHKEFFELVEEIDAHKQLTILRIKTHIDDKTKIAIVKYQDESRKLHQPTTVTHTIKIQEHLKDPNFRVKNKLPQMGYLADGSPDPNYALYAKGFHLNEIDKRGEKDNRLRMLSLGHGYDGLHSANREDHKQVRRSNLSMKDNYRKTVRKLNNLTREPLVNFRNIHTKYKKSPRRRFN